MSVSFQQSVQGKFKANRLAKEQSPYLLQHAYNPVDWYPWGDEAFAKAREEDKPIFLSIGYATCHWCHVMERESFENETIAVYLNKHFVSIKLDREERPDIDSLYMHVVQAMTSQGGWPLSVFLTPEKKPFYGGTYFPPTDRWGRPGFLNILKQLHVAWTEKRGEIEDSSERLLTVIDVTQNENRDQEISWDNNHLLWAKRDIQQRFDEQYGGFSEAPKFPQSHTLSFLLAMHSRGGDADALRMVEETLVAMSDGGLYDHLGGGIHRYATDEQWHVPHFEKMLYDQALYIKALADTYLITRKDYYKDKALETLEYIARDMTDIQGGFYSAEDADSYEREEAVHKKEGAFYIWQEVEIDTHLSTIEAAVFKAAYDVQSQGNVKVDAQGEFVGWNILHRVRSDQNLATLFQKEVDKIGRILKKAKIKLFKRREKRLRPLRDDKILTDWNGLMIATMAYVGRTLQDDRWIVVAERAAQFVLDQMVNEQGQLWHRYRQGHKIIPGMLDDYAFFVSGLIELYMATAQSKYLQEALHWNEQMLRLFQSPEGVFYNASFETKDLVLKQKEAYDGALPSGNAVAAYNLIRLARLTGHGYFEDKVLKIFNYFAKELKQGPFSTTQMLMAMDIAIGPSRELVYVAPEVNEAYIAMKNVVDCTYDPRMVILYRIKQDKNLSKFVPFVDQFPIPEEGVQVYVCRDHQCERPVSSEEALLNLL